MRLVGVAKGGFGDGELEERTGEGDVSGNPTPLQVKPTESFGQLDVDSLRRLLQGVHPQRVEEGRRLFVVTAVIELAPRLGGYNGRQQQNEGGNPGDRTHRSTVHA